MAPNKVVRDNLPPARGRGRPRGASNKTTVAVKEALTAAFDGLGGVGMLQTWANENQTEFYKLWAKMMPTQIDANVNAKVAGRIELVGVRPGGNRPA